MNNGYYFADGWLTMTTQTCPRMAVEAPDSARPFTTVAIPISTVETLLLEKGRYIVGEQEYDLLQSIMNAMRAGGMSGM
jgi:hypothetical protein